jgi:NAD(P)-dependent dehydrogenase (short-subunit alcohol dehydrogenase family)
VELQGKRVLITQSEDFMGPVLARAFEAHGATVIGDPRPLAEPAAAEDAVRAAGRVDVLIANLAVPAPSTRAHEVGDDEWRHVFSHLVDPLPRLARAVLPGMLERGEGYLLNVASAAGLLSQIGDTAYSATKHAAVGLAESLAITYAERGIRVSVVCPQYVATAITGFDEAVPEGSVAGLLTVEQAARAIVDGMEREQFLILTHAEVLGFFQRKAADYDRWLAGMRRLRAGLRAGGGFLKVKS